MVFPAATDLRHRLRWHVTVPLLARRLRRQARRADVWQRCVLIAGSPRSGSTWLAELVAAAARPGGIVLWEPFSPRHPAAAAAGFGWNTHLPAAGPATPIQAAYAAGVLRGDGLDRGHIAEPQARLHQLAGRRLRVVKCVRANLMVGWLAARFGVPAALLLRHPCAVVASQLRHPDWDGVGPGSVGLPASLAERHPHLAGLREGLADRTEALAFEWACQNLPPLGAGGDRMVRIGYEDAVADPGNALATLAAAGFPVRSRVPDRLRRTPSGSSLRPDRTVRPAAQIGRWRRQLDADQVRRVLATVAAAGIRGVGDDPAPNWSRVGVDPASIRSA